MNHLDRRRTAVFVLAGVLVPLLVAYIGVRVLVDDRTVARRTEVVVGEAGGQVVTPQPSPMATTPPSTPAPTNDPTPRPTVRVTPQPTAAPTPEPAEATPAPTAAEVAAEPPPPSAPPPTSGPAPTAPPPTPPPPTPAVAVAGDPSEAVATFYRHVSDGAFDAAYALWSDRMRAAYPRATNLDGRFAETASITFTDLRVASQSGSGATVQANFVERYDGGGSREFIGYWNLVRSGGTWLLDEPTY